MKWKNVEDLDFLNTGRQAKKRKFQKSQPEEQRESRAEGNHYGVREGTSKNLNQTANLLSRGKSEIPWRGIKENQNQGILDEGDPPHLPPRASKRKQPL